MHGGSNGASVGTAKRLRPESDEDKLAARIISAAKFGEQNVDYLIAQAK